MKIIEINKDNIENEHICCAIGNDKSNKARAQTKREWMKQEFENGLVFKRLNERGKVFIEYMPIENVWKPVTGKNHMIINCLWVAGKFKGKGLANQLLDECIKDSKSQKMDGIAVISSSKVKGFLTDKRLFEKKGFVTVDTAPPYFELLLLKFNKKAKNPEFTENVKKGTCSNKKGLTFIYSNQCPFNEEYVVLLCNLAKEKGFPYKIQKISNCKEAKKTGSPFGTLSIYYEGELKTHELMNEKKFEKFLSNL